MGINAFVERIGAKNSEEKEADARLRDNAKEAKALLKKIFDRISDSKDDNDNPITCLGPELTVISGVRVQVSQTNHSGGPGPSYNISVRDEKDTIHDYAQIRLSDAAIYYWDPDTGDRLTGTAAQDREVIGILQQAQLALEN